MSIKQSIRQKLRYFGVEIGRYPYRGEFEAWRRVRMLNHFGINTVLDVGANDGGFARELRDHGFGGKIISFEPLKDAFLKLDTIASRDPDWKTVKKALGDFDGEAEINISKNSASSSFLSMLGNHISAAPQSKYVSKQLVQVNMLDTVFKELHSVSNTYFMKIDTQGFEKNVIAGSQNSLKYIKAIQIETSLEPLYEDAPLFDEMYQYISSLGFRPCGFYPGFTDKKSGKQLQVDVTWIQNVS